MEESINSNSNFGEALEKYSSIFNNSHTPMLVINSESGQIIDGNLAATRYYGYSLEELKTLNIGDINILNRLEISTRMGQAKAERGGYFQFKHRLSSGEIRDVEVYSGPITVLGENYLLSIVHDTQYRKEMEQKIQIQESYFKSLFENSPEAVAILDCQFRVINVNESFERIFQYKIDEIKYKNVTEILCEELQYDESSYLKDSIIRGEFVRREMQRRRKDGSLVDISFLGYPIMFEGEQIGVYAIYTDLTKAKEEKKRQDKEIQMYISLLRSTIDSIPDVVSVYRPDFSIALLNEAGYKFFHIQYKQVEGMNWCTTLKDKLSTVECYGIKVIENQKAFYIEKWVPDTNQYFEWHCSPIFDEDGELILIVEKIKDITENKRREEELRAAKIKAEEANRFKTQFVANVAHEIRTPMNGIVGIIDLLDASQLSSEHKEYFSMLRYSAERLSTIVNDVMDMAKIEAGKLDIRNDKFSFNKLIDDIGRYFKIQAKNKALGFELHLDPAIPDELSGDIDKLHQVLFNLLSNAIKFTDQGLIRLGVRSMTKDKEHITVSFSVTDTGIGIPKEKLSYIFQDFVQIDSASTRKYGGAGLGLAIAKNLVELMGGTIQVVSEFTKGSTFSFQVSFQVMPVAEGFGSNVVEHTFNDVDTSLEGVKILIIEDEHINQKVLKEILMKRQCHVELATNGMEALIHLTQSDFDMILMDIYMPGMDGLELARTIRRNEKARGRYTPIIAITAAVMSEERALYEAVGIDDCIPKPFEKHIVYDAISKLLTGRVKVVYSLQPIFEAIDGNHKLLADIIDEVISLQYEEESLGKIQKYILDQNTDSLLKQIHKFKGSISHFEVKSINILLGEMKKYCNNLDFASCSQLLERLKIEYSSFRDFLINYKQKIKD